MRFLFTTGWRNCFLPEGEEASGGRWEFEDGSWEGEGLVNGARSG